MVADELGLCYLGNRNNYKGEWMNARVGGSVIVGILVIGTPWWAGAARASDACPYTAAELQTALGISVEEGRGTETPFRGGKMMDCQYKGKGRAGVSLSQTKSTSPSDAKMVAKGVAGQAIEGDPDGAIWVAAMGDSSRLSLSYVRGSTHTEMSITGVTSKNDKESKPINDKLQRLRRIP